MQLPNKLFSYDESILSNFPAVLNILIKEQQSVGALYKKLKKQIPSINEYIETLDALYALGKIEYCEEMEALYYVVRD